MNNSCLNLARWELKWCNEKKENMECPSRTLVWSMQSGFLFFRRSESQHNYVIFDIQNVWLASHAFFIVKKLIIHFSLRQLYPEEEHFTVLPPASEFIYDWKEDSIISYFILNIFLYYIENPYLYSNKVGKSQNHNNFY